MLKRILLFTIVLFVVACGNAPESKQDAVDGWSPTMSQDEFLRRVQKDLAISQPSPVLTTTYHAWDGTTVLDWNRGWDSLCGLTYYASVNGHLGSPVWSNGVPRIGSTAALWYSGTSLSHNVPPQLEATRIAHQDAHVFASATCWPFGVFEQLGVDPPWQLDNFDPAPPQLYMEADSNFSGSINWTQGAAQGVWTGNSFCYLAGHGGLSHSSESTSVYKFTNPNVVGGYEWRHNMAGRGALFSLLNCVYFGRSFNDFGGAVTTANPGQDVSSGVSQANGACFPTYVGSDADGGSAGAGYHIYIGDDYKWRIRTWGAVTAKMRCVSFFAP